MNELQRHYEYIIQRQLGDGSWIDWAPRLEAEYAVDRAKALETERPHLKFRVILRTSIDTEYVIPPPSPSTPDQAA
jgi:hypothetical protein